MRHTLNVEQASDSEWYSALVARHRESKSLRLEKHFSKTASLAEVTDTRRKIQRFSRRPFSLTRVSRLAFPAHFVQSCRSGVLSRHPQVWCVQAAVPQAPTLLQPQGLPSKLVRLDCCSPLVSNCQVSSCRQVLVFLLTRQSTLHGNHVFTTCSRHPLTHLNTSARQVSVKDASVFTRQRLARRRAERNEVRPGRDGARRWAARREGRTICPEHATRWRGAAGRAVGIAARSSRCSE